MIATVFRRGRSQRLEIQAFFILGFPEDGTAVRASIRMGKGPSAQVSRRGAALSVAVLSIVAAATQRQSDGLQAKPSQGSLFLPERDTSSVIFWDGRDKTPVIYSSYLFSASGLAVAKGQTTCSEAFPNKKLCSVFKVLDVKTWRWHKAKCFAQQLFDVGYMAAAHKPQRINSRTTAGPCASINKVENIFTVNVSHVLGDWRRFSSERFIAPSAVEGDFTVKFRLCLA